MDGMEDEQVIGKRRLHWTDEPVDVFRNCCELYVHCQWSYFLNLKNIWRNNVDVYSGSTTDSRPISPANQYQADDTPVPGGDVPAPATGQAVPGQGKPASWATTHYYYLLLHSKP